MPLPKDLVDFPIYSLSQSNLLHLNQYMTPLFCFIVSLSLGATNMLYSAPFEISLYTMFVAYDFNTFPDVLFYPVQWPPWVFGLGWCFLKVLYFFPSSSGVEQTALALCVSIVDTIFCSYVVVTVPL